MHWLYLLLHAQVRREGKGGGEIGREREGGEIKGEREREREGGGRERYDMYSTVKALMLGQSYEARHCTRTN